MAGPSPATGGGPAPQSGKKGAQMAQRELVAWLCDADGAVIPDGQQVTRRITVDGRPYEADLCAVHAGELDGVLARLRGPREARASRRSEASRRRAAEIRGWAQTWGYPVGDKGRIPKAVIAAYEAREDQ